MKKNKQNNDSNSDIEWDIEELKKAFYNAAEDYDDIINKMNEYNNES